MAHPLSDHQDTEHFRYDRSWVEIEDMLDKAERKMNYHQTQMIAYKDSQRKKAMFHARNYKALQGVCKTLRWTLGDMNINHPLD